jgi:hypothetical protein
LETPPARTTLHLTRNIGFRPMYLALFCGTDRLPPTQFSGSFVD